MADRIIDPAIAAEPPNTFGDVLGSLEDTIQALVDEAVDERFITPLRCRLLEGRNLDSAYGVTDADRLDFIARCQEVADELEDRIAANKATAAARALVEGAEDIPTIGTPAALGTLRDQLVASAAGAA